MNKHKKFININYVIRMMVLLVIIMPNILFSSTLQSIRVTESAKNSIIYCRFDKLPQTKVFVLSSPYRLVLDVNQAHVLRAVHPILLKKALILRMRQGAPNSHTLRLVFDLRAPVKIHTQKSHKELIISLLPTSTVRIPLKQVKFSQPRVDKINPRVASASMTQKKYHVGMSSLPFRAMPSVSAPGRRPVIIVLDPGHGGKDPGARGPGGVMEKNVVLAIAKKLKQQIDRQSGMRAILTRNGDYYIGLRQRLTIARRNNADIFVAIHADAYNNPSSHGASVFALSQRGATSEAARWLAEKENVSELGGVKWNHLTDRSIRTVLIDLSQTATINSSLQMGSSVLKHLGQLTSLHKNNVEQARFVVLKSPDIPSILVETGFISNKNEASHLTSGWYQERLSRAIFRGIQTYFWDYPPHGTYVEMMVNRQRRFL